MPTIDVQALSVGSIAANAFAPDFTNPACTVFERDFWGLTDTRYMAATDDTEFTVVTTADYRDVEVETWARSGEVFLALSADGKGIRFRWNEASGNGLYIQFVYGITDPPGTQGTAGTGIEPRYVDLDLTDFGGYDPDDATGRYYTFGVSGADIYVKMSGVEISRVKNPYHLVAGKIAFSGFVSDYGMKYITVTALAPVSLFSDPDNKIFDPRDYGLKELPTTGSITSGTPTLVVADATGYEIGDPIIVEIGAEAGLGLRGSVGVGGTWPTLSYANQAAMDADTTQVDGKWAYAIDTGKTKWWDDAANQWKRSSYAPGDYYHSLVIPIALTATITNIVGNTITLDTNASATATNANVYYDCHDGFDLLMIDADWDTARTISVPAGDYAINGYIDIGDYDWTWEFYGQGVDDTRIFAPDGARDTCLLITNLDTVSVHDFEITSNFGSNGYHLNPATAGAPDDIGRDQPPWLLIAPGVGITTTPATVYNVRSTEHVGPAFQGNYVTDVTWNNCEAYSSECPRTYLANWQYQVADSTATTPGSIAFRDCSFACPQIAPGFEAFRSSGVYYVRCSSLNGLMSSNSSGGHFLIDDCNFLFEEGNEAPSYTTAYGETVEPGPSFNNPIININSNIQPPDASMIEGGVIRNPTILIEGYSNVSLNHGYRALIIVNADNPNVTIEADPPWTERVCDAPLVGGYIENRIPWNVAHEGRGALAVGTDGQGLIVDGLRVVGTVNPAYLNIQSNTDTIVRNCVFDDGVSGPGAGNAVNNITNAEFLIVCQANAGPPTTLRAINYTHVIRRTKVVGY